MKVWTWNYAADPAVSNIPQAVQAYYDFSDPLSQALWVWSPEMWVNRRITFYLGGQRITAKQAAARLKVLPVLTHAHPFYYEHLPTAPKNFSPESIEATRDMNKQMYQSLTGWYFGRMTAAQADDIEHLADFEGFHDWSKAPLVPGAAYDVSADAAATQCHLFTRCVRDAGFDGPIANYDTSFSPDPLVAGGGNNRATPNHVPGAGDARSIVISGYSSGGPHGCLTEAEVMDAINKVPNKAWLILDDYQPGLSKLIQAARESGKISNLGLWGTVKGSVTDTRHRESGGDRGWQREMDAMISEAAGPAAGV